MNAPLFWNDSAVTEESYCEDCVRSEHKTEPEEDAAIQVFVDAGVPMELCDECAGDRKAEEKWDGRFDK